jgi:hypothetical protein
MPDGRVSQVRFEVLACRLGAFPFATRFKRWYTYAPTAKGLLTASYHLRRRLISGSEPGHRAANGTTKYPESLCLILALPLSGRRVPSSARTLLPGLSSYRLMCRSRSALPSFGLSLVRGVSAGCYQPLLPTGPSRRYLCESFPGCLGPCHGGTAECTCLFLPPRHRPSPVHYRGRLPAFPRPKRFHDGSPFRDCSHSFMFRPPSLLASPIVPTPATYRRRAAEAFTSEQNMLRYLRMHRIC